MKPEQLNQLANILTISHEHFVYTNVTAVIWAGNGLKSPSNVELNTGIILSKIYVDSESDKCLVIDFKGITQQVDHSLKPLFNVMNGIDREVLFINHDDLEDQLHSYTRFYLKSRNINDFNSNIKHIKSASSDVTKHISYTNIDAKISKLLKDNSLNWVKSSFQLFTSPQTLSSTPIIATGTFNALHIISNPKKFLWICVMIAREIELIKEKSKYPLRILSVSMNISAIALTVGLLTELKVDLVNQIGPEAKVYDQDELNYIRNELFVYNYIYVGDFTITGTEIKVARAYADALQCNLNYAVVIGSLFDKGIFKECFELSYLVRLDQVTDEAKYSLPTMSLIQT